MSTSTSPSLGWLTPLRRTPMSNSDVHSGDMVAGATPDSLSLWLSPSFPLETLRSDIVRTINDAVVYYAFQTPPRKMMTGNAAAVASKKSRSDARSLLVTTPDEGMPDEAQYLVATHAEAHCVDDLSPLSAVIGLPLQDSLSVQSDAHSEARCSPSPRFSVATPAEAHCLDAPRPSPPGDAIPCRSHQRLDSLRCEKGNPSDNMSTPTPPSLGWSTPLRRPPIFLAIPTEAIGAARDVRSPWPASSGATSDATHTNTYWHDIPSLSSAAMPDAPWPPAICPTPGSDARIILAASSGATYEATPPHTPWHDIPSPSSAATPDVPWPPTIRPTPGSDPRSTLLSSTVATFHATSSPDTPLPPDASSQSQSDALTTLPASPCLGVKRLDHALEQLFLSARSMLDAEEEDDLLLVQSVEHALEAFKLNRLRSTLEGAATTARVGGILKNLPAPSSIPSLDPRGLSKLWDYVGKFDEIRLKEKFCDDFQSIDLDSLFNYAAEEVKVNFPECTKFIKIDCLKSKVGTNPVSRGYRCTCCYKEGIPYSQSVAKLKFHWYVEGTHKGLHCWRTMNLEQLCDCIKVQVQDVTVFSNSL